jgi:hypothetical protein
MKRTFTKLSLIALLSIALPLGSQAASYALYLCGGSTATLQPGIAGIGVTDEVIWVDVTGGTNTPLKTATGANVGFTTPAGLAVGEHTYRVHVKSAAPGACESEVTDFVFYVLPPITVDLKTPTVPAYCTNTSTPSSVVEAEMGPAANAALTDIEYALTWTGEKNAVALDAAGLALVGSGTNTAFTATTTAIGSYTLKAKATYVLKAGAPGTIKSDCTTTSAASTAIVVSPQPAKPVITIS